MFGDEGDSLLVEGDERLSAQPAAFVVDQPIGKDPPPGTPGDWKGSAIGTIASYLLLTLRLKMKNARWLRAFLSY